MKQKMLELLVCPQCKEKLIWQQPVQELWCLKDRLAFSIQNDIPIMLISEARALTTQELDAC